MSKKNPITELLNSWPTRQVLADEIGANVAAVHKWATANRIPARWHHRVVKAAQAKGLEHVTPDWMIWHHDGGAA